MYTMFKRLVACVLAILTVGLSVGATDNVSNDLQEAPNGLMTELLANPELTSISDLKPEFSWIVNDIHQDEIQTAYQILVASNLDNSNANNGDMWDSGRVVSSESSCVEYNGSPLSNGSSYYWKVKTWDKDNNASEYSDYQQFNTIGEAYIRCADENSSFTLPGPSDVAYGANGKFYYKYGVSGNIDFNNFAFGGDPIPNVVKAGYYRYPSTGKPMETPDRYPLTTEEIDPVNIIDKGNGNYLVDFGRDAFAELKITLISENGGNTVNIRTGEQLKKDQTSINMNPVGSSSVESSISHWEGTITLDAGTKTYTLGDYYNYPFRYVEINGYTGTVDESMIKQVSYFYPSSETAASFTSSNERLNQIWELCKYSMKATSWCGVYVDGVREHTPYEADAYINQLGDYCTDREYSLARHSIQYLMENPTWPTDWPPQMALMADFEYMYTGNKDNIEAFYEALKTTSYLDKVDSANLLPKADIGLIENPIRKDPLVDWIDNYGYNSSGKYVAVSNAFFYKDLKILSKFANILGKNQEAVQYENLAESSKTAYNNMFFNTQNNSYVDSSGIRSKPVNPYANGYSAALGLVTEDKKEGVTTFLDSFSKMIALQYGAQYVLDGMYELNLDNKALKFMTDDENWWSMITAGSTITTEFFPAKNIGGDWNHAWGAAPANLIPRQLMGVQPIEPAYAKMQIKPQTGDLASANLTLPTIRGDVKVDVTKTPSLYTITTNIPANTKAKVYVRKCNTTGTTVMVDGVDKNGIEEGDFIVLDNVGSGTHTFERVVTPAPVVAFNSNGGTVIESKTVPTSGYITAPKAPTKVNYKFVGWYSDSALTIPFDFAKTKITTDITLYAKFAPNTLEVKFLNGATTVATKTVGFNELVTVIPTAPVKTGHTFIGWYTSPELTTPFNFTQTKITQATIVYAKYKINTYTVKFINESKAFATKKVIYNTLVPKPKTPTKKGYTFLGWFTAKTGGTKVVFPFKATATNRTLYAHWQLKAPTAIKLKKVSSKSVKVSWTKVPGASGYIVYYAKSAKGNFTKVKTKATSYKKTGLVKGNTYYFKVKTYKIVNGEKIYSPISITRKIKI